MTPAFEELVGELRRLPGLGSRSAERIAIHLLLEKRERLGTLSSALQAAAGQIEPCAECGHLSEGGRCEICADSSRKSQQICVVESVPDLFAMEKSGVYRGRYLVLGGKLSPLHGVGPEHLRMDLLEAQLQKGTVEEVILAMGNDIEGEATCHYIQQEISGMESVRCSRIGFGLPCGGGLVFADSGTLRSALEGRREFR